MKLHLDLLLTAILVASAGSELVARDSFAAAEPPEQICRPADKTAGETRLDAEQRIVSEGYTDVRILLKGCDNVWHATAMADGDPVNVQVTPQGVVLTE